MTIYLHKILPLIVSPLGLVFLLLIWAMFRRSTRYLFLAIVILYLASLPAVSNRLVAFLEGDYQRQVTAVAAQADAVVVLSGMVRSIPATNGYHLEWNNAVDRLFAGIDLIKAKKAPRLVLTRGLLPWDEGPPEGEQLKKVAVEMGVDPQAILLTETVQNTEQEAQAVRKLLPRENLSILLVTSAYHMPRAVQLFSQRGFTVIAYPVDFRAQDTSTSAMDLLPNAGALAETSLFTREMIGRLYYRLFR